MPRKKHPHLNPSILHAAKNGDIRAFEKIVYRYERPVYSFIYKRVGNRRDAEDLTQATFLKLYRNMNTYKSEHKFSSWLFTIAKHTVYDSFRKKVRAKEVPIMDDPDTQTELLDAIIVPHVEVRIEQKIDLERALKNLRPAYRTAIVLFYWKDYEYREIAREMNIPVNTVKTYLRRGKQRLKALLE